MCYQLDSGCCFANHEGKHQIFMLLPFPHLFFQLLIIFTWVISGRFSAPSASAETKGFACEGVVVQAGLGGSPSPMEAAASASLQHHGKIHLPPPRKLPRICCITSSSSSQGINHPEDTVDGNPGLPWGRQEFC